MEFLLSKQKGIIAIIKKTDQTRHPQRLRRRQVFRQGGEDHHHQRQRQAQQGGYREDGFRCREVPGRGREAEGPHRGQEQSRVLLVSLDFDDKLKIYLPAP